jgi:AcrR family transcriptional regulator
VTGLRERKKMETRQHIADTAAKLFGERGFEAVTVDEVAEAATVSKKTVFNYFPTKEDLVFDRAEERNEDLLRTVRDRPTGQPLTEAFRDRMLRYLDHLRTQPHLFQRGSVGDLINSSPALQRRAREMHHQSVRIVAAELAKVTGSPATDPVGLVVAQSLLGAHHMLFREVQRLLAEGCTPAQAANAVEPDAYRVFDLLAGGIKDYARND